MRFHCCGENSIIYGPLVIFHGFFCVSEEWGLSVELPQRTEHQLCQCKAIDSARWQDCWSQMPLPWFSASHLPQSVSLLSRKKSPSTISVLTHCERRADWRRNRHQFWLAAVLITYGQEGLLNKTWFVLWIEDPRQLTLLWLNIGYGSNSIKFDKSHG